jgi:leucyl/phenylalanyl-tRNA--protein transferase
VKSILELPRLGEEPASPFPSSRTALASPNGLLAWGGDLSPTRLLNAYRDGIFPWYSEGQPLLWWSPSPRCVLYPEKVYLSRRTRRRYNSGVFRLTMDRAFRPVIEGCAGPRPYEDSTWITGGMIDAYVQMHELGHAHSLEVWRGEDLAGGIYGLAIGSMFFGESMFGRQTDASKIALIALCKHLLQHGFGLMDCQVGNPHLFAMGAEEIPRHRFERALSQLTESEPQTSCWTPGLKFDDRW